MAGHLPKRGLKLVTLPWFQTPSTTLTSATYLRSSLHVVQVLGFLGILSKIPFLRIKYKRSTYVCITTTPSLIEEKLTKLYCTFKE